MSSKVAKYAFGKVAGKKSQQYEPPDPHYETYTDKRGRTKRRVRAMPANLTPKEQKILAKIRKRAHRLDKGMSLCGFRVGYTFFLGFIPFAGDIANALLGYNLVTKQAKKVDIPDNLASKMQFNTFVATGVGMIPIAGDFIMAAYKPNSRNANMFEDFLIERAKGRTAAGIDATTANAQAQQVIDRAKGGKWSRRTGENDALHTTTEDGYALQEPQAAYQGAGSNRSPHQQQHMSTAHLTQQPAAVKVAPPPVPPRP